MKLNADLSLRAAIQSTKLDWVASPLAGVERRMLDRDGDEVARATTIVRYAPGSYFSAHTHSGGEEFLVLDGTFSDEFGDFSAGFYIRNPVGSRHRPSSADGCVIVVKLHQMAADDQSWVRIDTRQAPWHEGALAGAEVQPLHRFQTEEAGIARLAPGTRIDNHSHAGGVELFVLDGSLSFGGKEWSAGAWLRFPPGDVHNLVSASGCRLFVKVGHLAARKSTAPSLLTLA